MYSQNSSVCPFHRPTRTLGALCGVVGAARSCPLTGDAGGRSPALYKKKHKTSPVDVVLVQGIVRNLFPRQLLLDHFRSDCLRFQAVREGAPRIKKALRAITGYPYIM